MKRFVLASATLAFFVPFVDRASAQPLTAEATHLRVEVIKQFGKRAPGRDIVKWGVVTIHGTRRATKAELTGYVGVLNRMLHPAPVPVTTTTTAVTHSTAVVTSTSSNASFSSSGAMPACTWVPESGGNWNAVNPTSGAGGRYQILPSTWAANGGTGLPQNASPAEQTRVALNVLHSQGIHAWVNC